MCTYCIQGYKDIYVKHLILSEKFMKKNSYWLLANSYFQGNGTSLWRMETKSTMLKYQF